MRIVVFVKAILDPEAPPGMIRFDGEVAGGSTPFVLGPFESNALELAARLAEASSSPFVALAAGGSEQEVALRKALSLGAGRAIRIDAAPGYHDPLTVARALAAAAGEADVYLFGRQAGDFDQAVTAGLFSGLIGAAFVPLVQEARLDGGHLMLRREIPGGYEELAVSTPVVISASNGPGTLMRLPKVKDVMMANRHPIDVLPFDSDGEATRIASMKPRESSRAGRRIEGDVATQAALLAEELRPYAAKGGGV